MNDIGAWYEELTYSEAKTILQENMTNMKMSFIAAGYYLKYIRDRDLFREDGYESIWEFAEDNYGIRKSTASRWMSMNDRFALGGNSPVLADEYKGFEKSQLQEMLYLDDKQIEEVTPDMTVKEIREVRKPEKKSPIERGCITGKSPYGNCVCCGKNDVECCAQCSADDCNGRCGWIDSAVATSQQDEEQIPGQMSIGDFPELLPDGDSLEEEGSEVEKVHGEIVGSEFVDDKTDHNESRESEKFEELSDQTDAELLRDLLNQAKDRLSLMMEEFSENDVRVRKQKLIVGAYAGMIAELDLYADQNREQPELPKLRNNDQRKAFLNNYREWPVWFRVNEASEVYYRYDLLDGSSIVICEYHFYLPWLRKDQDRTGTREYLLKPGYHYLEDCKTNTTTLVEHLKNIQKKVKEDVDRR